jgi:ribosomal protein S18 acetylase RimI-like enzyme
MDYTYEKYTATVMEVIGFFGQVSDVSPVKPGEVPENCYVAFTENDEPIGMLIADNTGYIPRVAVLESHRRSGVASGLFRTMAEDLSFKTAELESRDDQDSANSFYASTGWEKTTTRSAIDEDGSDFELYEWEIPQEELL